MSDNVQKQVWLHVLDRMKRYTKPAIAAVYGVEAEDHGLLVGSGTFMQILGATHLVSVSHVLEIAMEFQFLAHSNDYGTKPVPMKFPFHLQPYPLDLGFTRVDQEAMVQGAVTPWPVEVLAGATGDLDNDILFIHGYPGERSKWLPIINGGVTAESLPLGTVVRHEETGWVDFDPQLHFAMEYWRDGWFDEKGRTMSRPNPHCLSGSAVWRVNIKGRNHKDWRPEDARIVGILHRYNPDYDCLIATRVEHVRDFLLRMIRREHAYFSWLERGRPESDDWRDWFKSADAIPALRS